MMYRIYLEETATRTFHKDIEARTRQAAEAQGQAALASDAWTEWTEGLTDDTSVLYIDSARAGEQLVNQRLAYVAFSRGRHDAQVYSDLDLDRLVYALSRDVSKSSASSVHHEREGHAGHAGRPSSRHERHPRLAPDPERLGRPIRASGIRDASHERAATTVNPADRGFSAVGVHELSGIDCQCFGPFYRFNFNVDLRVRNR